MKKNIFFVLIVFAVLALCISCSSDPKQAYTIDYSIQPGHIEYSKSQSTAVTGEEVTFIITTWDNKGSIDVKNIDNGEFITGSITDAGSFSYNGPLNDVNLSSAVLPITVKFTVNSNISLGLGNPQPPA